MLHSLFYASLTLKYFFFNIGLLVSELVKGEGRDGDGGVRGARYFHIIINKKKLDNWLRLWKLLQWVWSGVGGGVGYWLKLRIS